MLQRIDIYIKYFNEKYFAKMRRLIFYFLVCIRQMRLIPKNEIHKMNELEAQGKHPNV